MCGARPDPVGDGGDAYRFAPFGEPDDGLRRRGQPIRFPQQVRWRGDAVFLQQQPVACQVRPPRRHALHPAPGQVLEIRNRDAFPFQPLREGFGQRMLRTRLHAVKYPAQPLLVPRPQQIRHDGFPFGERPGLVQYDGADAFRRFEALGIFYQDSCPGTLADAHHDGRRGRQPQGAGTRHDQHGHEGQQPVREPVVAAQYGPKHKGDEGDGDDGGHEYRRNPVDQLLHGRLAALCLLHHAHDVGQQGFRPDPFRPEQERPPLVDRPCVYFRPGSLAYGCGFAAQHTFVHVGTAFGDRAVHGDPLPRLHDDRIPGLHLRKGYGSLPSLRVGEGYGFGLQSHQFSDRRSRVALCPLFEQPAQQDEGDDHARGLEIHVRLDAAGEPESREQHVEDTEQVGRARTYRHERVHVGRSVPQLPPCADVEPASQPEYHRGREQPHGRDGVRHRLEEHGDRHDGQCQQHRPQGAALELPEVFRLRQLRLCGGIGAGAGHQVVARCADGFAQ